MGSANYSKCCDCDYFTKKKCAVELYNKICDIIVKANECEIIKCKDCKYHKVHTFNGKPKSYCDYFKGCWGTHEAKDDDFCSRAIRKDDEE